MKTRLHAAISSSSAVAFFDAFTSTLVCGWVALTETLIAGACRHPVVLVLAFVLVVGWASRVWNLLGAMLGLTAATFVFGLALFPPIGSLEISSPAARAGLFWMFIFGSASAFVFAPQRNGRSRNLHSGGVNC